MLRGPALLLGGCGGDPALETLRGDVMATSAIPGLTEVKRYETRSGSTLGNPVHAEVMRMLAGPAGTVTETDAASAAVIASGAGWRLEKLSRGGYLGAVRDLHGVRARLGISILDESPRRLVVILTVID